MADLDWQALAKASMHPLQVQILERASSDPDTRFSPTELADEFKAPLGNVSYHVRKLSQIGLLKSAGTTPVRGALQHHYKLTAKSLR